MDMPPSLGQDTALTSQTLWSHQAEAVRRLQHLSAAGLFFEMGAGKTLTALRLLEVWQARRVIVVSPKTVMDVWRREIEKWAPDLKAIILNQQNTLKKRAYLDEQLQFANGSAAVIINYDSIWREPLGKRFMALPWDVIVADESHRIKSPGGISSRYMARLGGKIPRRLALTGSPLPHSPLDLYAQYRYLDPNIFGWSFTRFRARYAVLGGFGGHQVLKFVNLEELHQKMYQIAVRVKAEDVLDLPETLDETLTFDLSPAARKIYDALEKDLIAFLDSGVIVTVPNVLAKLIKLQQITGGWLTADGLFPKVQAQKPGAGRQGQAGQVGNRHQCRPFSCQPGSALLARPSFSSKQEAKMSVDKDTVRRIARLARLAVPESRLEPMAGELNGIFQWVEMLGEVNVDGVAPMTSVVAQKLKWRTDEVTDGGVADALMSNAPGGEDHFFVVPKVVE